MNPIVLPSRTISGRNPNSSGIIAVRTHTGSDRFTVPAPVPCRTRCLRPLSKTYLAGVGGKVPVEGIGTLIWDIEDDLGV